MVLNDNMVGITRKEPYVHQHNEHLIIKILESLRPQISQTFCEANDKMLDTEPSNQPEL